MTKSLQKIGALLLIPVILFSSFGFTINVHYCKGELKNYALFVEAEDCDMANSSNETDETLPPCHQKKLKEQLEKNSRSENSNGLIKDNCCHNETFIFESNQEVEESASEITSTNLQLVMIACILFDYSFFSQTVSQPAYTDYDPPRIRQDFSVLYQSFLI